MKRLIATGIALLLAGAAAPAPTAGYSNDFEKADLGKTPEELLVLNGNFAVTQEPGNRFLRVAPTPLDGFAILFGADDATTTAVEARIRATSVHRRYPEFGIGLCGPGGYRLWMMPATGQLQLIKGEKIQAHCPIEWTSGSWMRLKLQVHSVGTDRWKVVGKAWPDGQTEPADWTLAFDETEKPFGGRASAWGSPYSETPIDFDDLRAGPAK